ncbi:MULTISPECIES: AtpZ/AtpI family protein [Rhodopseudomonas]|jgi:ATP synthase protein I|uniref:ATP synthase protein I n=1 Tax=Rhodopseudomonas palustris (strain DX-1) TaxID=652103 RepID=E6VBR8_RHOPX|nr:MULTISPECIES: AtpZ/AtpI family protein [Rhodopseudomonas]NEW85679.1 F0F1 ATP synthase assembly protein I [Rhodopseudomonas sp. WA056]QDL95861.1 F0F1 ATP synthase assembly protein I [Rhodopseudomonas palustris]
MADDTHDSSRRAHGTRDGSPEEAALSARLGSLEQRLAHSRAGRKLQTDQSETESETGHAKASAMALGFRLSSELIAGVLGGAALGWGFDRLLSTSPWGLIVFSLLGFTAGVINVMRAAGVMAKQSERL